MTPKEIEEKIYECSKVIDILSSEDYPEKNIREYDIIEQLKYCGYLERIEALIDTYHKMADFYNDQNKAERDDRHSENAEIFERLKDAILETPFWQGFMSFTPSDYSKIRNRENDINILITNIKRIDEIISANIATLEQLKEELEIKEDNTENKNSVVGQYFEEISDQLDRVRNLLDSYDDYDFSKIADLLPDLEKALQNENMNHYTQVK